MIAAHSILPGKVREVSRKRAKTVAFYLLALASNSGNWAAPLAITDQAARWTAEFLAAKRHKNHKN
jgi:hypothetical protein